MKILFITYDYLPVGSAEANILSKLVSELNKNDNVFIDILTTKYNVNQPNIESVNGINIYRILFGRNISLRRDKLNFRQFVTVFFDKIIDIFYNQIKVKKFLNYFLVNRIYNAMKKYKWNEYDFIIPVSGYFEMYQAAQKFIKKKNIKCKLFLYQLDPISNNNSYGFKTANIRRKFEKKLSIDCNGVITTDYLINQKKLLGINVDNCYGFEFPNVTDMTNISKNSNIKKNETIIAIFAGTLHFDVRNPKYTFELFSKIKTNAKMVIIGTGCNALIDEYIKKFPSKFEYLGKLDFSITNEKLFESDFLINIGNNNVNFVPSKIFDYISTGKPIINIYKSTLCPTLKYLSMYDNCISILEDYELFDEQLAQLETFFNQNKNKRLAYNEIKAKFNNYTAEYMATELYNIFKNVSNVRKEEKNEKNMYAD